MEETFDDILKKKIFEVNKETGLSGDFCTVLHTYVSLLKDSFEKNGKEGIRTMIKKFPFHMKKYTVAYADSMNDTNKKSIEELDKLVDEINRILENPDLIDENTFKSFIETVNKINLLVYGADGIKF